MAQTDGSATPADSLILSADSITADSTLTADSHLLRERIKENAKEIIRKLDRFDSDYIEPDHYDWTVMMQNTNFFQNIIMSGRNAEGNVQDLSFNLKPSLKIGPYIGWRWIFFGYTVDVARPAKLGKATNLNLSVYTNMIGGDIFYLRNKGNYRLQKTAGFQGVGKRQFRRQSFSGLNSYHFGVYVYFILNHRRFSYPAAYNQSTRQKLSAGSWIFGLRYDHQHISFDYTQLPEPILQTNGEESQLNPSLKFSQYKYSDYSLSAGYAYNWVFAKNWLANVSVAPYLGFRKEFGSTTQYNHILERFVHKIGVGMVCRAGIVWNNGKGFFGTSFITYDNLFHGKELLVANSSNYLNIYGGFYFGLKKKYRLSK